jgi:hypothetical protein
VVGALGISRNSMASIDSDEDRLVMISGLGGQSVSASRGSFQAIFHNGYQGVLADPIMESASPSLACRTSDVQRLGIQKGEPLGVAGTTYRLMRHEPDGTGMSVLVLKT